MDFPLFGELIVGGMKIKDGLFIGDNYAAQDFEFIFNNKITRIINCSCKEVPNYFEAQGIEYLSIPWEETDTQILFDQRGQTLAIICEFIEDARKRGDSVLVHSFKGQSRASCAICAYFMRVFHWGFYKTLEFLDSRRPDLEIRRNFFDQLKSLAQKLALGSEISNSWEICISNDPEIKMEETIIRNTFFNSKLDGPDPAKKRLKSKKKKGEKRKKKIKWIDEKSTKKKTVVSNFYSRGERMNLSHDRSRSASKSILKTKPDPNNIYATLQQNNVERPDLTDSALDNTHQMHRTEPVKSTANDSAGFTTASRGQRMSSASKNKEDSDSKTGRRLLGDSKRKKKGLYQSNSSKRLDSAKPVKRGSTPRRRKDDSESRKKISSSFSKAKEIEKQMSQLQISTGFQKPPTSKKPLTNPALDKYKNDNLLSVIMGNRQEGSGSNSDDPRSETLSKKARTKMEIYSLEDPKTNSISKNSTGVPEDSKDQAKAQKSKLRGLKPPSGKLSKLSSLQPRYRLDENNNTANEKMDRSLQAKLIEMMADGTAGNHGQKYLNFSNNEKSLNKDRVPTDSINTPGSAKHGVLLKNQAFRAHRLDNYEEASKAKNRPDTGKTPSRLISKGRRPNSAPVKEDQKDKKKKKDEKTTKVFSNLFPSYKKMGHLIGSNLLRGHFFKAGEANKPNAIYTGPVIKKRVLN